MLPLLAACTPATLPPLPARGADADRVVVLIHGAGDGPDDWPADWAEALPPALVEPERWDVWRYDWEQDGAEKIDAARLAEAHGAWLGAGLDDAGYEHVHLVAHSAGAFVADGALRAATGGGTRHATFLDPYGWRGLLDVEWGAAHFGEGADFADAYLNRGDGVPATDLTSTRSLTVDLTDEAPAGLDAQAGHRFPIGWVLQTLTDPEARYGFALAAERTGLPPDGYPEGLGPGDVVQP